METGPALKIEKGLNPVVLIWAVALVLRAFGLAFSGLMFLTTSALILILQVRACILAFRQRSSPMSYVAMTLAYILCIPKLFVSFEGAALAVLAAIIIDMTLIAALLSHVKRISMWHLVMVAVVSFCGYSSAGSFHRTFRHGCFESYVTDHFPAGSAEAFRIIESNLPDEDLRRQKARDLFKQASNGFQSRQTEKGYDAICRSLELDPKQSDAYLLRGKFRLLQMELDQTQAQGAIKDFTRSIIIDSTCGEAYFRRAMATLFIDHHAAVCNDLEQTLRLDSTFSQYVWEMADSSCKASLRRTFTPPDP